MPATEPKKPQTKDPSGKTQLQLATEAGVSLETWKQWQRDKRLGGADLANRKKQAEIRRIEVATSKEQQYLSIARGEFYPKEEVEKGFRQLAAFEGSFASAVLSEFPSLLAGLKPAEIEPIVRRFLDEWDEKRADQRGEVWKLAREAVQAQFRGDMRKVVAAQKRGEEGE